MFYVANPAPFNPPPPSPLEIAYIAYMLLSIVFMAFLIYEFTVLHQQIEELIKTSKEQKGKQ